MMLKFDVAGWQAVKDLAATIGPPEGLRILVLLDVAEACAESLLNLLQLVAPHVHDDEDPCPGCAEVFRSRAFALRNRAFEVLQAVEWGV